MRECSSVAMTSGFSSSRYFSAITRTPMPYLYCPRNVRFLFPIGSREKSQKGVFLRGAATLHGVVFNF